jgi:hypothetical protein
LPGLHIEGERMKQEMNRDWPNDETGELLRLMQEQGDDLSLPRDIDFFLIFETRDEALAFANQADLGREFRVDTSRYEKTSKWQARLTAHLVPVHAEIVMLEKQVARLGREHGGQPDGWGCAPAP